MWVLCCTHMTLSQVTDDFFLWKSTHVAPRSLLTYKCSIKPIIKEFGQKDVEDLTLNDISRIAQKYQLEHKSVMQLFAVFKMFTKYAFYSGIKVINPELIKSPRVKIQVDRPYATRDDIKKLRSGCDENTFVGVRNVALISMLFDTGARLSEILSLNLEHLTDGQTLYAKITTKKNGKPRYIVWSEKTHKLLQRYLGLRICIDCATSKLFINKNGKSLGPRGVEHFFVKLRHAVNLNKELTPHSLRHGKAHDMLSGKSKGGVANVKEIGAVLGHSDHNTKSALQYIVLENTESLDIAKRFIQ